MLAVPDVGDKGQAADADGEDDPLVTALRRDLAAARGRTLLAPSMAAGFGGGPGVSPHDEYQAKRFGIDAPESTIELRRDVERSVLSCYGILPALFHPQAAGTALREAARTVHALSAVPVAELVAAQFSEALGEPVTLDLRRGRATDIATQARAVGSLVHGRGRRQRGPGDSWNMTRRERFTEAWPVHGVRPVP